MGACTVAIVPSKPRSLKRFETQHCDSGSGIVSTKASSQKTQVITKIRVLSISKYNSATSLAVICSWVKSIRTLFHQHPLNYRKQLFDSTHPNRKHVYPAHANGYLLIECRSVRSKRISGTQITRKTRVQTGSTAQRSQTQGHSNGNNRKHRCWNDAGICPSYGQDEGQFGV